VLDDQEPRYSARRELVSATLVAGGAAFVLGILWLVSQGAPSATRDPFMTQPRLVPTPTPTPQPAASPIATPRSRERRRARRRPRRSGTPEAGEAASP
jgi:hypothetical protein